jgi:predicted small lipoprotein YifL
MRTRTLIALMLFAVLVSGCGQKGDLVRPKPPADQTTAQ